MEVFMKKIILLTFCLGLILISSTLLAQGNLFGPPINYPVGTSPIYVFSEDLDADNDYDLIIANDDSNNITILINDGNGIFDSSITYETGSGPRSIYSTDLDSDNDNDIAVANIWSNNVSIFLNNGDGTFQEDVTYGVGEDPWSVFSTDLDGDNDNDLAVANWDSGNVSILLNNGNGTFQSDVTYSTNTGSHCVNCADLDGDNDNDLVVANLLSHNVSVLFNNGDGTFQPKVTYETNGAAAFIAAIDLDGDNDNDLAVSHWIQSYDGISIFLNNGDGTFQSEMNYGGQYTSRSIFSADFDGDYDIDLVVTNYLFDSVAVLLNSGDGSFYVEGSYEVENEPVSVFSADFNGDNDYDLAVVSIATNTVGVLLNISNACLVCNTVAYTHRIPNSNGTIIWDLIVQNCGEVTVPVYAEIYPTAGDCASGTPLDIDRNRLVTGNLGLGDSILVPYWLRPGTVNGIVQAALQINVGPAIDNYISNCCFEFIFTQGWGASNNSRSWGEFSEWGVRSDEVMLPLKASLFQNYPNPFNATTNIGFNLSKDENTTLKIYNLSGQLVETLVDEQLKAGKYNIEWNASMYASGVYFYKLTIEDRVFIKRMVLLK